MAVLVSDQISEFQGISSPGGISTGGGSPIVNQHISSSRGGGSGRMDSISFDPGLAPESEAAAEEQKETAQIKQLSKRAFYGTIAVFIALIMLLMREK